MTEQTYWKKLTKTGWLKYVPKDFRAEIRDRFKKGFKTHQESIHLALTQTGFDAECIDGPQSYCRLLRYWAKDSGGLFQPTQIKSALSTHGRQTSIKVSFRHKRKAFSCVVPFDSDWFQPEVLGLVNQALEASGRKQRFIFLPAAGQLVFLAIVPPRVYDKAVEAGLIPRDDMCE